MFKIFFKNDHFSSNDIDQLIFQANNNDVIIIDKDKSVTIPNDLVLTGNLNDTTPLELSYLSGLASNIQSQLDGLFDSTTNLATTYPLLDATKADKSTTYTKTEVDTSLALKANQATTYTKTEVDTTLS